MRGSSLLSAEVYRGHGQTLTVRKKAQADRKSPRGKNEMSLPQILKKEVVGSYRVIGLRMDDRAEVQRRVGECMWERIIVREGTRMEERCEAVRALVLVFADQRTRSAPS